MTDESQKQLKEIIEKIFFEGDKMIGQRINQKFLSNHNLLFLNDYFTDSESLTETIFRIKNDIFSKRPVCPCCGKPVKFKYGFNRYCSAKCRNSSEEMKMLNAASVSKALRKVYKEKGEEIKRKRKETLKKHYGVEVSSPFQIQEISKKVNDTIRDKYGVDNIFCTESARAKNKSTSQKNL